MEQRPSTPPLTLESPAEIVHQTILNKLHRDSFIGYVQSGQRVHAKDPIGLYEECDSFLKSDFVKAKLQQQWQYETGPDWDEQKKQGKRTTSVALYETVEHTFGNIKAMSDFFKMMPDDEDVKKFFQGVDPSSVQQLGEDSLVILNYFKSTQAFRK